MEDFSPRPRLLRSRSFYLQCLCTLTDAYRGSYLPQTGPVNKQSQQAERRSPTPTYQWLPAPLPQ